MTTMDLGNAALGLALFAAVAAFLAAMASARFASVRLLHAAQGALAATFLFITFAALVLLALLIGSDFRVDYVVRETERALPLGYKFAAFWSGQSGSLLLWAWLLAAMSLLAVLGIGRKNNDEKSLVQHTVACAVLAIVVGFFVAVILCAANPFDLLRDPLTKLPVLAMDGRGMNPMLQNFGMIVHPPLLYLGYAGFTIPFAFMFGALVARLNDDAWVAQLRRWTLAAWLFLTVGILLGAQWAYVELGWGGYWSWDPVENSSLLPWFTATALLHSMVAQEQRGMFRRWTAALIAATFLLCIFGTYLTRSGVLSTYSTHSYAASNLGTSFVVFLALALQDSLVLLMLRWDSLGSRQPIDHWISRDAAFVLANILLVSMMLLTLVGTVFPLLSSVMGKPISVGASYYAQAVLPLALALVAVMSLGPALSSNTPRQILRHIRLPALAALAAVAIGLLVCPVMRNGWCIAVTAVAAAAFTCVIAEFFIAWTARMHARQENPFLAFWRLLDSNHRRYGAQIAHLGLILLIIGVTGSSLFRVETKIPNFAPGQTQSFADGTLTFDDCRHITQDNYEAIEADIIFRDAQGRPTMLHPQYRRYTNTHNESSEVALRSNLARDLYATLTGVDIKGSDVIISLHAMINPLVNWIWIGGLVMMVGVLVGLVPRLSSASLQPEIRA